MEEITSTTTTGKPAGIPPAPPSLSRSVTSHPENKKQRYDRCFSFMEIKIDPGIKSLKRLDSRKFKFEIQRWAKAVVRYARQVSDRFGTRQASEVNSRG
ncbi:hypothetical protein CTI12_AA246910 [Artemisia annua]|uniref:Uncharacterized protein n=1 Tax=Artemisia annua TaxID=35608 RepID=A0A2U1MNW8_ARTAN|nr:hypothetical protein CTI12_AA246910 [Artemisia annua]